MNYDDAKDITDLFNKAFNYDLRVYGWKILHEIQIGRSHIVVIPEEKIVAFQKGIFLDNFLLKVMLRKHVQQFIDINTGHLIDAFHGLYEPDEIRFAVVNGFAILKCPEATIHTKIGVGTKSEGGFQLDIINELSLQSQIGNQYVPPLSIKRIASNDTNKYIGINLREHTLEIREDTRHWNDIFLVDFHSTTPELISFTKHHIVLRSVDENYYIVKQHQTYNIFIHNGIMTFNKDNTSCEWSNKILGYGDLVINPYNRDIADYVENEVVYDGEYIFKNHHDTYVKIGEEWIMVNDNWFHSPRIPKNVRDEYAMCKNLKSINI